MNKYDLLTVRQMFAVPEPEMLVESILPRRTLTGLTAYPGTGKTWLTLELARAVSTGTKFLGKFKAEVGNVVFVGQDASIQDYARQLRKLIKADYEKYNSEVADRHRSINPFDDRLHFCIQPGFLLEDKERVKTLANTVLSIDHSETPELVHDPDTDTWTPVSKVVTGTDLIILDTLFSMTRVDMKNNTLMDVTFRNLRWLAEATGAGVVLVHHNPKPTEFNEGEDWLGPISQIAALDNWFNLKKSSPRSDKINFKVKKVRGIKPDDFQFDLHADAEKASLTYLEEGEEGVVEAEIQLDVKEMVINWLGMNRGFHPAREITEALWPAASDFYSSERTFYGRVCAVLNNPENTELIEKGPRRLGFRIREINEDQPE